LTNLSPFLIYVFVTTFTPGPNNIMAMTNAMHYGYRRTLKFLLGMIMGFFIIMFASGILNAWLAGLVPSIEKWLKILGAVYMLYLAYHIARSKPEDIDEEKSSNNTFRAGFTMQFLNVKVILYGITVYSLFITPIYKSPVAIAVFAMILALIGFTALSAWAFGGNVFRNSLRKRYHLFNYSMASLLVYTAIASLI
jgi:cysteine/O-acetylserine efflux protein